MLSAALNTDRTNIKNIQTLLDDNVEKVLGLRWLVDSDQLSFNFNKNKITNNLYEQRPTKRQLLSVIMSIFDPLGFLAPYTTHSRILMQLLWSKEVKWDDKIPDEEFEIWKIWLHEIDFVKDCKISRYYMSTESEIKSIELHIFCDASKKAYAAVGYWRFILSNNSYRVSIIMAKSRVTPLKATTIPRLELQAALLATRLAHTIKTEHEFTIKRQVFWSDSKTVLCWIKKDPREFKTFVANRLGEIREATNVLDWYWVPSRENPADDATRFVPSALKNNSRWLLGPEFLQSDETKWPRQISIKDYNHTN